jgi:hypothetical protein
VPNSVVCNPVFLAGQVLLSTLLGSGESFLGVKVGYAMLPGTVLPITILVWSPWFLREPPAVDLLSKMLIVVALSASIPFLLVTPSLPPRYAGVPASGILGGAVSETIIVIAC